MEANASFGLLLATLAGLSTAIGGGIAIFMCRPKCGQLALILVGNVAFFAGIAFIGVIDFLVPHEYKEERIGDSHPSLVSRLTSVTQSGQRGRSSVLMRTGVLTALGVTIHNFPEGLVVFSAAIGGDVTLGIIVAVAMGLHNIPEGISIFVPIFEPSWVTLS